MNNLPPEVELTVYFIFLFIALVGLVAAVVLSVIGRRPEKQPDEHEDIFNQQQ